jgi:hypothetical protein
VISSSLFLLILLSSASTRRWRNTRISLDTTLHVYQKQDKPVNRVLPYWVLGCSLFFFLSSSISFFSSQTSRVCSCLRVLSWYVLVNLLANLAIFLLQLVESIFNISELVRLLLGVVGQFLPNIRIIIRQGQARWQRQSSPV